MTILNVGGQIKNSRKALGMNLGVVQECFKEVVVEVPPSLTNNPPASPTPRMSHLSDLSLRPLFSKSTGLELKAPTLLCL